MIKKKINQMMKIIKKKKFKYNRFLKKLKRENRMLRLLKQNQKQTKNKKNQIKKFKSKDKVQGKNPFLLQNKDKE